jgi:ribonuclease HI
MNFDGASKGNPGLSGAGAVIYKNGNEIWSSCKFVGYKTNNQAEYSALILGLKGALNLGITSLSVLGDSLLVINQVNNIYKVKSVCLHELYKEAQSLKTEFDYIDFSHVYREFNKRADELSNLALEKASDPDVELGIKHLDEDWDEEIKINELTQKNTTEPAPVKVVKLPSVKQLSITEFFKMESILPNI